MSNGDNGIILNDRIVRESLDVGKAISNFMYQPPEPPEKVILPEGVIDRYVGQYQQPNGRLIRIAKEGDGIRISGVGIPTGVFVPQSRNKFFWPNYDVQLEFEKSTIDSTWHMLIYEKGKQVMDAEKIR